MNREMKNIRLILMGSTPGYRRLINNRRIKSAYPVRNLLIILEVSENGTNPHDYCSGVDILFSEC